MLAASKRRGLLGNLPARVCSGGGLRPTVRAADTASPWACRGGWSGKVASPAVVVGRHRRAADALVGREAEEGSALNAKRESRGSKAKWFGSSESGWLNRRRQVERR